MTSTYNKVSSVILLSAWIKSYIFYLLDILSPQICPYARHHGGERQHASQETWQRDTLDMSTGKVQVEGGERASSSVAGSCSPACAIRLPGSVPEMWRFVIFSQEQHKLWYTIPCHITFSSRSLIQSTAARIRAK